MSARCLLPAACSLLLVLWQSRVGSLQQQLSRAEQEAERLSGLLAAAEAAAAAARAREESARAAGREYAERARRAATLHEETDADLAEVSMPVCSGACHIADIFN